MVYIYISQNLRRFYTSKRWLFGISEPSTVAPFSTMGRVELEDTIQSRTVLRPEFADLH